MYTQCTFKQNNTFSIGWIESKHAKVGNKVEILTKGFKGLWDIIATGNISSTDPSMKYRTWNNNI